jgi:hypothetical protein
MSPEQILGKELDRRSDVFALAVVMYEMLAIRRLFHRDSDFLTFKAITEEPIPDIRERRPDLPPGMRAALFQAMARDVNGRFDTAQAFGNAIRNAVATLGGPATLPDLARLLTSDFAEEMASRDEILKAADEPAPIAPRPARTTSPPPLPRPPAIPGTTGAVGEIGAHDSQPHRAGAGPLDAIPSMIVQPGSSRLQLPAVLPGRAPGQVIDLSSNMMPDSWMVDPNTDLLRSHRLRSIRNAAIAIGAVAVIGVVVFLVTNRLGDTSRAAPPPITDVAAEAPDAAVEPPIDAPTGPTRDDIVALSHFGFFSINATAKTQIYVDNKQIGDTPLIRIPLTPGPHKVKAIGPKGKTRLINTTVYGGRDTDEGMITW